MRLFKILAFLTCLICSLAQQNLWSQETFELTKVDVEINGEILKDPFYGGFSAPQFDKMDLDLDGKEDLIVLDRAGEVILPFLNKGSIGEADYEFAPEYQSIFGRVINWFRLRDFNGDGLKDLFTFPINSIPSAAGIEVRKAVIKNGELSFELVNFDLSIFPFNGLCYQGNNGFINIYVPSTDISEIIDVDHDGDLDILSFDQGGSVISYFQNLVVEEGLSLDTFKYVLADECWGRFKEAPFDAALTLSSNPSDCAEGFHSGGSFGSRHAGSTITALDVNGDEAYELLIGDLLSNNITLLNNGNVENEAWMSSLDADFPSYDLPADFPLFLSSSHIDIDNDGLKDLIFAPNDSGNSANISNAWYYKNVGTESNAIFEFVQEDFLQEGTIDQGEFSTPVLFDYNFDGKLDILVGCTGEYLSSANYEARLVLYKNIGTENEARFVLEDTDYASYAQFASVSNILSPAIGDLDGDGDDDLIVGDHNGYLFYSENIAGPGNLAEYNTAIYQFMDIDVGSKAKPEIFDIDEDGLSDLIIGERNGAAVDGVIVNVNFYRNVGSIGNPVFNEEEGNYNPIFGGINTRVQNSSTGEASPRILDIGDDIWVITGSLRGGITVYNNIKGNTESIFDTLALGWGGVYPELNLTLDVGDIDNDGLLELVTGAKRGGISYYETNITTSGLTSVHVPSIEPDDILFFPNPVNDVLSLNYAGKYSIWTMTGKSVQRGYAQNQLDLSHLSPGIYLFRTENGRIHRFIKL